MNVRKKRGRSVRAASSPHSAVTIEGIARQIGRGRTSLYGRWPGKPNLVAYAVVSEMGDEPAADTGGLRGDIEAAVETLRKAFAGPLGHALAGLVADRAQDTALAVSIRQQVISARRNRCARRSSVRVCAARSDPGWMLSSCSTC